MCNLNDLPKTPIEWTKLIHHAKTHVRSLYRNRMRDISPTFRHRRFETDCQSHTLGYMTLKFLTLTQFGRHGPK